jgi:hypothetical protein
LLGAYSFKPLALLLFRQEVVYAVRGS